MAGMNLKVANPEIKNNTNILDIKIPAQLLVRHKVKINWFNDMLGGEGLTPSTVLMLTGGPGCGKTTFTLQLADSLTGDGHIVLYNTGEESLYQVAMVTKRLRLKNGFITGQHVSAPDLIKNLESLQKLHPKKQVILIQDSLQTLNDEYYKDGGTTSATPLRCTELLTNWAKSTFGIAAFIGQVTKDGIFQGKNGIKHAIDAHAELNIDLNKKSETYGERLFTMSKNRFGSSGKTIIVGIGSEGLFEKGRYEDSDS